MAAVAQTERGVSGNFRQKKYPVNPISYMRQHGINRIFRYVQTHPDMDHMDGIEAIFDEFKPINFYDTDNTKEIPSSQWEGSSYRESDWRFYKRLRDANPRTNPKRLTLYSGDRGPYRTENWEGQEGGDGIRILAPTPELVTAANKSGQNYHSCS